MNNHWARAIIASLLLATLVVASHARRSFAAEPAASPEKKAGTLLLAHKWGDSAGYYSLATGKQENVVPLGRRPHELALSHDGRRAYFTLYGLDLYTETAEGGKSIAVLDVPGRAKVGEIELGKYRRPHGIEIGHRSGHLYVTCDHPAALLVIDPQKGEIATAVELSQPQSLCHMVTVMADESRAYLANCGTADVSVIDLAARKETHRVPVGGIPMGMALSADGKTLWATTRVANGVAVIDTQSNKVTRIIEITGQPVRLALTADGRWLLVTLIDSGEVAVVDAHKQTLEHRIPIGRRVEGLTIDPAGQFGYASAQADNKVVRFSIGEWKAVAEILTDPRPDPLVVLP